MKDISIFMHLFDNGYTDDAKKYAIEKKIDFKKYSVKQQFIDRYINYKTKTKTKSNTLMNSISKNKFLRKLINKFKTN